jgi:hypothetical protein
LKTPHSKPGHRSDCVALLRERGEVQGVPTVRVARG